ncbi:MAG: extracellular solute-binding protein [Oscillospiraceae bacterium]|nr:extracellular solute-binding protein [Oscillospiraceae bacterium]
MKKTTALILCILFVLSAFVAAVSGCSLIPGNKTGKGVTETVTGTNATSSDEEPWPVRDMGESVFRILGRSGFKNKDYIYNPETEDDVINDALNTRNEWLKDHYNFTLEFTEVADAEYMATAKAELSGGTAGYDLFVAPGRTIATISQEGSLIDLASQKNIDLKAEWWDQSANRDLSIAGRVFITTGAMSTSDMNSTYVIFFNKDLIEEKSLENPYQLVYDNKWTIDKMLELCKGVKVDINDDGKWTNVDMYGYVCENYDSYAMFFSSGEKVIGKDNDDLPALCVNTSRASEVIDSLKTFYSDESTYVNLAADIIPIIKAGRSVFCGTILGAISSYREMEADFGIIPLPKYEVDQDEYISPVSAATTGSLIGVPVSSTDIDASTFMLEMLCRKSLTTLRTAYYDVVVTKQSLRDEDSKKMLEKIQAGHMFDIAYMNDWGGWFLWLYSIAGNPSGANLASQFDAQQANTNKLIQDTIDVYMKYINE